MTKTLTDKWRSGNLKNSFYYLKFPDTETVEIYNIYDMEKFRYVQDSEKIDVLDEVPSYDEYNELATKCSQLEEDVKILKKQLEIATKVLKHMAKFPTYYHDYTSDAARKYLKEMEGVK